MTKLAIPATSGTSTWELTSNPPTPVELLNPPLNAASRRGASSAAMVDPAPGLMAALPAGGSELPSWSRNTVRPARNRNTVT